MHESGEGPLEYQRKVAKQLQDYFIRAEETGERSFLWLVSWARMRSATAGRLAEQMGDVRICSRTVDRVCNPASFVQQLKILLSNFVIIDLE
ncbi:hypothetical protein OPV22_017463 [Ensete ventricosum]|uniref:Uncharacterized protein n=1 Tax=Ensete ventricosum TaxID=4639 RepID=A0AAV8QXA1_ENSVE|nr:hypothetical protein OPV22_017463 [Ensete ventricosum]